MNSMLSYESALATILSSIRTLPAVALPLDQCAGRRCAEAVHAVDDLPPFDNSAMDGFAVHADDVGGASASAPVTLRIRARLPAGAAAEGVAIGAGECVRVFTGSMLPRGADAVVMQEDTRPVECAADQVAVLDAVKPWENIRFAGADVKRGGIVAESGALLESRRLALLAAAGNQRATVHRQPVVAILATGDELVEPGSPLKPGQIHESNRLMLASLVQESGCASRVYPLVADEPAATRAALSTAIEQCDAVITSGGASVGELDFIKQAFLDIGGELDFWRVAMKPGKPFLFGGASLKPLFGLPGNPVSAWVTYWMLVHPAMLRLQGAAHCAHRTYPATLAERIRNPGARRHFMRVRVTADGLIRSTGVQASHMLFSLAEANALLDLPPEADWPVGRSVSVLPLPG